MAVNQIVYFLYKSGNRLPFCWGGGGASIWRISNGSRPFDLLFASGMSTTLSLFYLFRAGGDGSRGGYLFVCLPSFVRCH